MPQNLQEDPRAVRVAEERSLRKHEKERIGKNPNTMTLKEEILLVPSNGVFPTHGDQQTGNLNDLLRNNIL